MQHRNAKSDIHIEEGYNATPFTGNIKLLAGTIPTFGTGSGKTNLLLRCTYLQDRVTEVESLSGPS